MKRINNLVIGLIIILIVTACSNGRIESLERKPNESIVIAKLKIMNYDEDVTEDSGVLFDEILWGTYGVLPDDSCFIYLKLPVGNHYLARIANGNKSINLPETMLRFETPESKIYYLGDITVKLELDMNISAAFGLIGAMAYEGRNVKQPPFTVDNKIEDAKKYFNSMFPSNETITQCKFYCDSTSVLDSNNVRKDGLNKKEARRLHKN